MPQDLIHDPLSIIPHLSHMRLGRVTQADHALIPVPMTKGPLTALALQYANSGKGGPPVPRPFLGGVQTGFHAMPNLGDEVMTLYEPKFKPTGSTSVTSNPAKLDVLSLGESLQRHADGRIADYLKTDGSSTLYSDPAHSASLLVDTTRKLTATFASTALANTGTVSITGTTLTAMTNLTLTSSSAVLTSGLSLGGHVAVSGLAPGLSSIGSQFSGVSISGNDTAGRITVTSSTTLTASLAYSLASVGYHTAYSGSQTPHVQLTVAGVNLLATVGVTSTTGFTIVLTPMLTGSMGTFTIDYLVVANF